MLGANSPAEGFLLASDGAVMRACFLGPNICALGFGVALVQSPPLAEAFDLQAGDDFARSRAEIPLPSKILENRMIQDLRRRDVANGWG